MLFVEYTHFSLSWLVFLFSMYMYLHSDIFNNYKQTDSDGTKGL